jgi:hypothetical protein
MNLSGKNLNSLTKLSIPRIIEEYFLCGYNKLSTLEGGPEIVTGFVCYCNELISLKGSPKKVENMFFCANNYLTSLIYFPKKRRYMNFSYYKNHLLTLDYF